MSFFIFEETNGDQNTQTQVSNDITEQGKKTNVTVDDEKLLFSVFLLLYRLGSDERPEVLYV